MIIKLEAIARNFFLVLRFELIYAAFTCGRCHELRFTQLINTLVGREVQGTESYAQLCRYIEGRYLIFLSKLSICTTIDSYRDMICIEAASRRDRGNKKRYWKIYASRQIPLLYCYHHLPRGKLILFASRPPRGVIEAAICIAFLHRGINEATSGRVFLKCTKLRLSGSLRGCLDGIWC